MEYLIAGQIDTASPAANPAAEMYVLSSGFGQPIGTDTPLLVETEDFAPAGQDGWTILKRINVPFTFRGACSVRVTPITDYQTELTPTVKSFAAPASEAVGEVAALVSKRCRIVRARVEVTSRNAVVELGVASAVHSPVTSAHPAPAGAQA